MKSCKGSGSSCSPMMLSFLLSVAGIARPGARATIAATHTNSHAIPVYSIQTALSPRNIYEVLSNPLNNLCNFILWREDFVGSGILESDEREGNSPIANTNSGTMATTVNYDFNWSDKLAMMFRAVAG